MSSLVHVLSSLAAKWVRCECGLSVAIAGEDGWKKNGLRLGSAIDSLNAQIPRIRKPDKRAEKQAELAKLDALSTALTDEWESANEETDEFARLFWVARDFCVKACGVGDPELFNAALVGFDPSQLNATQEPSKQRMSEIVSLLRNLPRNEWEMQPWANSIKPKMRSRGRVTPKMLQSFIAGQLKYGSSEAVTKPMSGGRAGGNETPLKDSDDPTKWTGWIQTKVVKPWFGAKNVARSPTGWTKLANELRAEGLIENHPTGKAKRIRIHDDVFVRFGIKRPELTG